jgi:hypothetical protein
VRAKVEHAVGIVKRVFGFKGTLSGAGEKRQPVVRRLRAGESVHGATAAAASRTRLSRPAERHLPSITRKTAKETGTHTSTVIISAQPNS